MNLQVNAQTYVDLTRPDLQEKIRSRIHDCLEDYPDFAEGIIFLDDVEHFFTYRVHEREQFAEVIVLPRGWAEEVLNEHGLSTDEPWSPLKRHA